VPLVIGTKELAISEILAPMANDPENACLVHHESANVEPVSHRFVLEAHVAQ
jgi:hypothetical protein